MSNLLLALIIFAILLPSAVPQGKQAIRTTGLAVAIAALAVAVMVMK